MSRFSRITGEGKLADIGDESLELAVHFGLPTKPKSLANLYKLIAAMSVDGGQDAITYSTSRKKFVPKSVKGADFALDAIEILGGDKRPRQDSVILEDGVHQHINRPMMLDVVRDRAYWQGFGFVARAAAASHGVMVSPNVSEIELGDIADLDPYRIAVGKELALVARPLESVLDSHPALQIYSVTHDSDGIICVTFESFSHTPLSSHPDSQLV